MFHQKEDMESNTEQWYLMQVNETEGESFIPYTHEEFQWKSLYNEKILILDYVTVHQAGKTNLKTHLLSASRVLTF